MKWCGCIDSIDFFQYFGFVLVLCWHSIKKVAWEEKYDSTCYETDIWYACLRVTALAGEDRDFFAVQWQAASCKRACCECWRGDMGAGASAGVGLCAGYTQQEGSPLWKSTWTINECAWFDLYPMYGYFYMDSWKCRSVEQFLPCMWRCTSRLIFLEKIQTRSHHDHAQILLPSVGTPSLVHLRLLPARPAPEVPARTCETRKRQPRSTSLKRKKIDDFSSFCIFDPQSSHTYRPINVCGLFRKFSSLFAAD